MDKLYNGIKRELEECLDARIYEQLRSKRLNEMGILAKVSLKIFTWEISLPVTLRIKTLKTNNLLEN